MRSALISTFFLASIVAIATVGCTPLAITALCHDREITCEYEETYDNRRGGGDHDGRDDGRDDGSDGKDNASEHNGRGGNDGEGGKSRDGGKNSDKGST